MVSQVDQHVAQLEAAVDALTALQADELDDDTLRAVTRAEHRVERRLEAHRTELVAARAHRSAQQARHERPDDVRAPERACRDVQRDYAKDLQIDPSQAKRSLKVGRQLETLPRARRLFRDGHIARRHVELLADTLAPFAGEQRDRHEARLCEAAVNESPVTFGRTCRRLLAEEDSDAAMRRLDAQHAKRRATVAQTPAGTTVISGEGVGEDAEILHTAIEAFRRPDAADERRTPEQRTWDALVDVAAAALRAGEAPENHGTIPHVSVLIDDRVLRDQRGVGELEHTGPLPYEELTRILGNSRYAAILTDTSGLPLQVFHETRYVPVGLYKALRVRDETCIWPGCDMPGRWCDAAHFDVPFRRDGKLSLEGSGLLCRRHHRQLDHGPYVVRFVDRLPVVYHRNGAPLVAESAPAAPVRAGPPSGGTPRPPGDTSAESRGPYDAAPAHGSTAPGERLVSRRARKGSSALSEQRVDLLDRGADALLRAHGQHLLEVGGRVVDRRDRHARVRVVDGFDRDLGAAHGQVVVRLAAVLGEAVDEGQPARRLDPQAVGRCGRLPGSRSTSCPRPSWC